MKRKIAIFSALVVLGGARVAAASDCVGPECEIERITYIAEDVYEPAPMGYIAPAAPAYAEPTQYIYSTQIPMRSVKTLSIKPVPEDTRPALWDGTNASYKPRAYDKTVDWRDGVPIWDDSIVNYRAKDFSDWFLEPMPEIYLRPVDGPSYVAPVQMYGAVETDDVMALYTDTMADAAETRARVEELLAPRRPCSNLWTDDAPVVSQTMVVAPAAPTCVPAPEYVAQDLTVAVNAAFGNDDGCPFDSETECNIWRRKPIVRETVSPRSPMIRAGNMDAFISAARCNKEIRADDALAAPLLDRYKMLMRSARACCADGMAYQLRRAGASDGLIYKFMSDDANFYGFGDRCLMMTDAELDAKYPNTSTAVVAADVRNGCLCRGRQWFAAMLAPFQQVYAAAPEFAQQKFYYTYTDGLQRDVTVSVNTDVQNVLNQLALCP